MNADELLTELQRLGVQLKVDDDRLAVHAPKGTLTLELQRALKAQKQEIIDLLLGNIWTQEQERAMWQQIRERRARVGIPQWLVPDTEDWKKQVERNGIQDMLRRRRAWFDQQKRLNDVVLAGEA